MTLRELADFVPFAGVASLETGQRSTPVAKDNNRQRMAGLDIAGFTLARRRAESPGQTIAIDFMELINTGAIAGNSE